MVSPNHVHAGQFAVGACGRLQTARREAGDFLKGFLQFVHQPQRALGGFLGLQRVQVGKAGQAADGFVDFRVVLHRAGAEGVEVDVHRVVEMRKAGVVAHHVHLGNLRQRQVFPQQTLRQGCGGHIQVGEAHAFPPRRGKFNNKGFFHLEGHQCTSPNASASRSMASRVFISVTATSSTSRNASP